LIEKEMTKRKIFIIDKLVTGYNHIVFNASIAQIIAESFKNDHVSFICESTHASALQDKNRGIPNLDYVRYTETPLPAGRLNKVVPWIKKKLKDIGFISHSYKEYIKHADLVVFTCLSTSTLLFAGWKAMKVKIPVYFFLHGEIEYLFQKDLGLASRLRSKLYKIFLRKLSPNCKVLVLSDIVKHKLIEDQYVVPERIFTIDHPVIPVNYQTKGVSSEKIIFGHIGLALLKKSSDLFFQLASRHRTAINTGKVEFQLVGRIEHDLVVEDSGLVKLLAKDNQSLNQSEYEQHLLAMDYAIFTFNNNNYVYRTSGSVIDAITFNKPIIALKHRYFNYLFEVAGNIGFLCNDIDELDMLLTKIIEKDPELLGQYNVQVQNMNRLSKTYAVDEIKSKWQPLLMNV
jgi:hypothetical protein